MKRLIIELIVLFLLMGAYVFAGPSYHGTSITAAASSKITVFWSYGKAVVFHNNQ